ncbi:transposase, partial [bacterium]|nr:transposase [bacterium]
MKRRAFIWHDFVFNRYTIKQLAAKYDHSFDWIHKELRAYKLPLVKVTPRVIVAVMDCVFFGQSRGYLIVRDPHRHENVYYAEIERETRAEYWHARCELEDMGFIIQAVVADGKPGLKPLYEDVPVQMCHFHQKLIITRYLTRRPKLDAGKELREVVHRLGKSDEKCFARELDVWHKKWCEFLAEKTVNTEAGKWHYTHKRLRSAYMSLKRHLPYL